ncbi:unnamed protein product [Adineta steineri]|uniref:Uncharacterized protein n=1 Tax=Adineta steineri TaxID=433720 RepID=A0A815VHM8_9BILA|nr:unnamed protein product [Adineta steineri]CAF1655498.1 unnamed protein product [Adineta steineri]
MHVNSQIFLRKSRLSLPIITPSRINFPTVKSSVIVMLAVAVLLGSDYCCAGGGGGYRCCSAPLFGNTSSCNTLI